ncbi:MAG: uroporphyrinogen decarboxylase family protein [Desulfococcus multivorans]|jgi:uroporphyrinogen decarboxylase|uniref:uroporphyrinogen decarboxylase family protein n=1 Tax=Desulfococcus sp. TaxID=2025834 RepID=UPI002A46D84F|nr:uroporphyrinogen decarboxylase family protein [Desulfococcus multivorans]
MAKQLLIDATLGRRTAIPPWVPYAGVNCAHLIREKADRYFRNPDLMAKGVVEAARTYRADGIPLLFDLSLEAESVGCGVEYWEDNVPSVRTHPCDKQPPEVVGLALPEKSSGRWPVVFEAAKIARPQLDAMDCAMLGLMTGPLTLASHLAGVRIFTAVKKDPAFAHAVIRFAGEIGARAAAFYVEMGCDVIAIVDPVASQIRPETFREFVTPNCAASVRTIHAGGRASSFFICGDCTKVVEAVCDVGTHAFAVDEQMNLNFIRDIARKHGKGFGGNLKLTLALSLGLISPREDALISLAAGGTHGYTFAPG